jgi:putative transposase
MTASWAITVRRFTSSCAMIVSEPRHSHTAISTRATSLFRTTKYRPEFPVKGFATLDAARDWGASFVHWYNVEHKHSGICYVSPHQRHTEDDDTILAAHHALYRTAKGLNPARWSRNTRNWQSIGPVTLNPERDSIISEHSARHHIQ